MTTESRVRSVRAPTARPGGNGGKRSIRTPWHLWPVAALVLAMYVGGARDFFLVATRDTGYITEKFGSTGLTYFTDYPPELWTLWAVNVAAGLLSPLLLFARRRTAVWPACVAALSQIVLCAVTFGYRDRWESLGTPIALWDIGIVVGTTLFAWYCLRLHRRGALR